MGHKPHHWSLHQSTWENAALISCIYPRGGEPQAQTETSCSGTKLILHGCEVPGLLTSLRSSAMPKSSYSVLPAPQHCASQLVAVAALRKDALTARRWMPKYTTDTIFDWDLMMD